MKARKVVFVVFEFGDDDPFQTEQVVLMNRESHAGASAVRAKLYKRDEVNFKSATVTITHLETMALAGSTDPVFDEEKKGAIRHALGLATAFPGTAQATLPSSVPSLGVGGNDNSNSGIGQSSDNSAPEAGLYIYFHCDNQGDVSGELTNDILARCVMEMRQFAPGLRKVCFVGCFFATGERQEEGSKSSLEEVCEQAKLEDVMFAGWDIALTTIGESNEAIDDKPKKRTLGSPPQPMFPLPALTQGLVGEKDGRKATTKQLGRDKEKVKYLLPIANQAGLREEHKKIVCWKSGKVETLGLDAWKDL
jgi:hypothetical protein